MNDFKYQFPGGKSLQFIHYMSTINCIRIIVYARYITFTKPPYPTRSFDTEPDSLCRIWLIWYHFYSKINTVSLCVCLGWILLFVCVVATLGFCKEYLPFQSNVLTSTVTSMCNCSIPIVSPVCSVYTLRMRQSRWVHWPVPGVWTNYTLHTLTWGMNY